MISSQGLDISLRGGVPGSDVVGSMCPRQSIQVLGPSQHPGIDLLGCKCMQASQAFPPLYMSLFGPGRDTPAAPAAPAARGHGQTVSSSSSGRN